MVGRFRDLSNGQSDGVEGGVATRVLGRLTMDEVDLERLIANEFGGSRSFNDEDDVG